MPTIVILGNLKIQMFADDHNPPHFHVSSPDYDLMIRISDLSILSGQMRSKDIRKITEWAERNRTRIVDEWNRLNPNR